MTGKQRFAAVLHGETPDRLPIYIPTVACTVAEQILGRPCHTGADSLHFKEEKALFLGQSAHEDFLAQYLRDITELYHILGVDVVRDTWRCNGVPSAMPDENTLIFGDPDGAHIVKRFFPDTQTYGVVAGTRPAADPDILLEGLEHSLADQPELPFSPGSFAAANTVSRAIFAACPDCGAIVSGGGVTFPGYDPTWLQAAALEPELVCAYLLRSVRQQIHAMREGAEAGYTFFNGGGDIAGQTGPLVSPALFARAIQPAAKAYSDACRALGVIFCYRSDGDMSPLLPLIFEQAGVAAYGEVDRDAGMTVEMLRQRLPDTIILGNTSSSLLVNATPEAIRADTRAQLQAAGGRYFIPGPSNAVVHGTPVANLMAMLEVLHG